MSNICNFLIHINILPEFQIRIYCPNKYHFSQLLENSLQFYNVKWFIETFQVSAQEPILEDRSDKIRQEGSPRLPKHLGFYKAFKKGKGGWNPLVKVYVANFV